MRHFDQAAVFNAESCLEYKFVKSMLATGIVWVCSEEWGTTVIRQERKLFQQLHKNSLRFIPLLCLYMLIFSIVGASGKLAWRLCMIQNKLPGATCFMTVSQIKARVSNLKMKVCKTTPLQYFCKGPPYLDINHTLKKILLHKMFVPITVQNIQ